MSSDGERCLGDLSPATAPAHHNHRRTNITLLINRSWLNLCQLFLFYDAVTPERDVWIRPVIHSPSGSRIRLCLNPGALFLVVLLFFVVCCHLEQAGSLQTCWFVAEMSRSLRGLQSLLASPW